MHQEQVHRQVKDAQKLTHKRLLSPPKISSRLINLRSFGKLIGNRMLFYLWVVSLLGVNFTREKPFDSPGHGKETRNKPRLIHPLDRSAVNRKWFVSFFFFSVAWGIFLFFFCFDHIFLWSPCLFRFLFVGSFILWPTRRKENKRHWGSTAKKILAKR